MAKRKTKNGRIEYAEEFKYKAVGESVYKPKAVVCKEFDISRPVLYKWLKEPWAEEAIKQAEEFKENEKNIVKFEEVLKERKIKTVHTNDKGEVTKITNEDEFTDEAITDLQDIKNLALKQLATKIRTCDNALHLAKIAETIHKMQVLLLPADEQEAKNYLLMLEEKINKPK